ncbi:MAG: methionine adenosyltransferase domain-containing protein, partial [Bacteroidales bacterium]|nr:methionine adenosyltransferase domain-containing protein [Bacteroidales bacterium]
MTYLRPDSKSQVTIEYSDDNKPLGIDTIVISTQHDEFVKPADNTPEAQEKADRQMLDTITNDVKNILIPRLKEKLSPVEKKLFDKEFKLFVNPTGKFVIGGPHGDTGLTGRKIIVDTYGGKGAHGGGAFSGKDPSKVDRSAAYATRHIAKNLVAAGICDEVLVQVAYAIGVAKPVGIYVNTYGTKKVKESDSQIAEKIAKIFDLRPSGIIKRLKLKNPVFLPTASYGHFGRKPYTQTVEVQENGKTVKKDVEFFTWEKLDYVETLKKEFCI